MASQLSLYQAMELIFFVARLEDTGNFKKTKMNVALIYLLFRDALGISTPKNCGNNRQTGSP